MKTVTCYLPFHHKLNLLFLSPSQRAHCALSSFMPCHSFHWFWIHSFSIFFCLGTHLFSESITHYFYQTPLSFFRVASTKLTVSCLQLSRRAWSNDCTLVHLPSILLIYAVKLLFESFSCVPLGNLRAAVKAQLRIFQHYLNSIVLFTCPALLFCYTKFSFPLLRLILRVEFSSTVKACW